MLNGAWRRLFVCSSRRFPGTYEAVFDPPVGPRYKAVIKLDANRGLVSYIMHVRELIWNMRSHGTYRARTTGARIGGS